MTEPAPRHRSARALPLAGIALLLAAGACAAASRGAPEDAVSGGTRLETIPGVKRRTAEVLAAEVGVTMAPFPTAHHLASWAGMTPGNNASAGKPEDPVHYQRA